MLKCNVNSHETDLQTIQNQLKMLRPAGLHQWLATSEAEIGRLAVQGHPEQKDPQMALQPMQLGAVA
jgi:hypothetical protein